MNEHTVTTDAAPLNHSPRRFAGRGLLVIAAFVVLLPLLFMEKTILGGNPLARDDAGQLVYPQFYALAESLRNRQLYLWDSSQFCGLPVLARGETGGLYPPHLLFFSLLPWMTAIHAGYWLHLALALAGFVWVGRNLRLSWGGALVGAVIYTFSGYSAAHLIHYNIIAAVAHLPLMLALLQTALRHNRPHWWALWGLQLAVAFFASQPQIWLMGVSVCLLWLIAGRWWDHSPQTATTGAVRSRIVGLLGAVIGGMLLTMPQVLPTLELLRLAGAGGEGGAEFMAGYAFLPRDLARVLLPSIFGTVENNVIGGGPAFHETCAFIGGGPILLALAGLIAARRQPGYLFAVVTFITGAVLMPAEGNPIYALAARLPIVSEFRAMGRWAILPIFSLGLLAGMALSRLPKADERTQKVLVRVVGGLAALIILAVAGLWATFGVNNDGVLVWPGHPDQAVPLTVIADAVYNCVTGWEPILLAASIIVTTLVLLRHAGKGRRYAPAAVLLIMLAVAIPLLHFWQITNQPVSPTYYTELPAAARAVGEGRVERITVLPPGAVMTSENAADIARADTRDILAPALGLVYDLRYSDGYIHRLATPGTLDLWREYHHYGVQAFSGHHNLSDESIRRMGSSLERMTRLHALAGCQYIIAPVLLEDPALRLLADDPVYVYRHTNLHPRAWLVGMAVHEPDLDQQRVLMRQRSFRPDEIALVAQPVAALQPLPPGSGAVFVTSDTGTTLELRVRSPSQALLVVADAWYPGWEAEIDGRAAEMIRTNYAFRGVVVDAGEHTVVFRFKPVPWRRGLILAAVGLLLLMGMCVWSYKANTNRDILITGL